MVLLESKLSKRLDKYGICLICLMVSSGRAEKSYQGYILLCQPHPSILKKGAVEMISRARAMGQSQKNEKIVRMMPLIPENTALSASYVVWRIWGMLVLMPHQRMKRFDSTKRSGSGPPRVSEYMEAKPSWQSMLRKWHSISGEARGIEPWSSFYRGPSSFCVSYAPTGYRLVSALDEFLDLLSIVGECKSHFLDINSSLSKGEMLVIDDAWTEGSILYGRKRRKYDDPVANSIVISADHNKAVVSEKKVNKITREQSSTSRISYIFLRKLDL